MRRSRPWSERPVETTASASLEFLTVGMLLLVPFVYLVLAVAAIQAGRSASRARRGRRRGSRCSARRPAHRMPPWSARCA